MPGLVATVGTSGEKEFRQAIAQITREVKTSAAEMKVLTERYKGNEQSQEALTEQARVLSRTIEAQERQVEEMDRAYKNAVNIYGETSKEALSWQKRLYTTTAELEKNRRQLRETNEALSDNARSTDNAETQVRQFDNAEEKATKQTSRFGDVLKANLASDLIKGGLRALVQGVRQLGNNLVSTGRDAASFADEINTLSVQTSANVQDLQKYSVVAELVDTSLETMASSMAKNVRSMNSGKEAYEQLGVSVRDESGALRDANTVYWETIDALGNVGDETTRDALAMEIFGKSAQDLNPLIEQGSDGIKELTDRAEKMNAVLSEDSVKALGALDDSLQWLKATFTGTGRLIAAAFAPAATSIIDSATEAGSALNGLIDAMMNGGDVAKASDNLGESVSGLIDNLSTVITDKVLPMAGNILGTIGGAIIKNLPQLTSKAFTVISQLARAFLENIGKLATVGIQIITTLTNGIAKELPTLIPLAVQAIIDLVTALTDNIGLLTDSAVLLIDGLIEGLEKAMPLLMDQAPVILEKLVLAFSENAPKLLEAAGKLMTVMATSLADNAPLLVEQIPTILKALATGFVSYQAALIEVGASLMGSIWDGIKSSAERYWVMLQHWLQGVASAIQNLFANGFTQENLQASLNMANPFNYMSIPRTLAGTEAGVYVPNKRLVYEGNVTLDGDAVGRFAVNAVTKELYAQ